MDFFGLLLPLAKGHLLTKMENEYMKKIIIRRVAAFCAAVMFLASGCSSGNEHASVSDESITKTTEKIQIEIEYDGDEVLGDAIRKIADGFNSSQDIYEAVVGSAGTNLQELAGEPQSAENLPDEASEIESAEGRQDELGGTESVENLQGDSGQRDESLTASVVFTDDDTAAAYSADYRRLDLRTCKGIESGKNSLYTIIASLPEHMYETVCDEEHGIFICLSQ